MKQQMRQRDLKASIHLVIAHLGPVWLLKLREGNENENENGNENLVYFYVWLL